MSSRIGNIFCPNPPPTSPMITRMRASGRPRIRAQIARNSCGPCVAAHTVSCSLAGSHWATSPRVSIGTHT